MKQLPKLGLVTVLYNSAGVLPGFFESLRTQTYTNIILYVIDNSPDDASLDCARRECENFPHAVRFIRNAGNYGVAKGNNQGISIALEDCCSYILLLNNDIEFPANTIHDIVAFALREKAMIVVPKIYYHGSNHLWYAGGEMKFLFGAGSHRGDRSFDAGHYNNFEVVSYAPTCFMLISNTVFLDIGLMDEDYFIYFDDTDFVYRANKNHNILYNPDCIIYHKVSFSSGGVGDDRVVTRFGRSSHRLSIKRFSFSGYLNIRNHIYFINKHYKFISKYLVILLTISRYAFGIVLYDDRKLLRMKILVQAINDARHKRMGIPDLINYKNLP